MRKVVRDTSLKGSDGIMTPVEGLFHVQPTKKAMEMGYNFYFSISVV